MSKYEIIIFPNRQEVVAFDDNNIPFKAATFYSHKILDMFLKQCKENKERFLIEVKD